MRNKIRSVVFAAVLSSALWVPSLAEAGNKHF
jgi:hypothetical protein